VLRRCVDARPGSNTVPTCCDRVVARRPLQGKAGTGEGVIFTREDGEPAVAPEGWGMHRPGRQAQAKASGAGEVEVELGEGGIVSNQMETCRHAQE
jgi:hypothetical protein